MVPLRSIGIHTNMHDIFNVLNPVANSCDAVNLYPSLWVGDDLNLEPDAY